MQRIPLSDTVAILGERSTDLLSLDEALTNLSATDSRMCQVVEMRFFGGLTTEQTSEVLGISSRTVEREWCLAKAWLRLQVNQGTEDEP